MEEKEKEKVKKTKKNVTGKSLIEMEIEVGELKSEQPSTTKKLIKSGFMTEPMSM